MTRRDSRAELQKWFLDVDELLAAQREHAISPSTVPLATAEPATWTTTLSALRDDLVELIELLVSSPGRWIFILDAGRPGGRYVQLLVYEDGSIVAEVSSNNFLEDSDRLSTDQEKAFLTMGWKENAPHHGVARTPSSRQAQLVVGAGNDQPGYQRGRQPRFRDV